MSGMALRSRGLAYHPGGRKRPVLAGCCLDHACPAAELANGGQRRAEAMLATDAAGPPGDDAPRPDEMQPKMGFDGLSLSVVIPAYNEEGALRATVEDVRGELEPLGIPYEIIVVDDGSRDATRNEAMASGATVDWNDVNTGYGATLKRGVRRARYEYLAIIDADGTYPARCLPEMRCFAATATWSSAAAARR
jgi:hypothetical protein